MLIVLSVSHVWKRKILSGNSEKEQALWHSLTALEALIKKCHSNLIISCFFFSTLLCHLLLSVFFNSTFLQ